MVIRYASIRLAPLLGRAQRPSRIGMAPRPQQVHMFMCAPRRDGRQAGRPSRRAPCAHRAERARGDAFSGRRNRCAFPELFVATAK